MKRRISLVLGLMVSLALAAPASAATFPEQIDLPNGWAPEGITAGRGTTVYVGSLATGAIWKGDVASGVGDTLVPGGNAPAVGIYYEERHERLWAAGGPTGQVHVYDANSGAHLETYQFSPVGFLNDVVVTDRAAYVTDSMVQQLVIIPIADGGALADPADAWTVPLTGDIEYIPGEFNVNGIEKTPGWLIIVQSVPGKLFRVDRWTGLTEEIDLGGVSVSSGDGLERHGRTLYVVRNFLNQVDVFHLSDDNLSAELLGTLTSDGLDVPTTAAFVRSRLWAVNARFNVTPGPDVPYWITQLPPRP
jgi:hypothetical protein